MSPETAQDDAATRQAIEAVNKKFSDAVSRGDAAAIAALYGSRAQAFPPNAEPVTTRDGIKGVFQGAIDAGVKSVALETVEVQPFGDTAYEVGRYTMTGADGTQLDRGKYIVVWTRENGEWKLHRDFWSSSVAKP